MGISLRVRAWLGSRIPRSRKLEANAEYCLIRRIRLEFALSASRISFDRNTVTAEREARVCRETVQFRSLITHSWLGCFVGVKLCSWQCTLQSSVMYRACAVYANASIF